MSYMLRVRLDDGQKDVLDNIASANNLTMSEVVKLLIAAVDSGSISVTDRKVVATVIQYKEEVVATPPDESFLDDSEYDFKRLGFYRVLEKLKAKGYPDEAIRRMNEQNADMVSDMPKYNPRKVRGWDGC